MLVKITNFPKGIASSAWLPPAITGGTSRLVLNGHISDIHQGAVALEERTVAVTSTNPCFEEPGAIISVISYNNSNPMYN